MQKFIVTISREVEYTTAFEIHATTREQADVLAKAKAAALPTDDLNWDGYAHCTSVSVFRKTATPIIDIK